MFSLSAQRIKVTSRFATGSLLTPPSNESSKDAFHFRQLCFHSNIVLYLGLLKDIPKAPCDL